VSAQGQKKGKRVSPPTPSIGDQQLDTEKMHPRKRGDKGGARRSRSISSLGGRGDRSKMSQPRSRMEKRGFALRSRS